jgi:radical SAM superfamily enzyme YgiQ (UPF0313 family)
LWDNYGINKILMKILLVYPQYPPTFWSFKSIMKLVGKKASFPPLGLLTVSALLPAKWQRKLVDMNVEELKEEDLRWADMVFLSAMIIQKESVGEVIRRAKALGKKIVAGGPLFTTGWEEYTSSVDHLILGEAEGTLPLFLTDLKKGKLKKTYQLDSFPDLKKSVIPDYHLINLRNYFSLCVQFSRGCPFNCEFCDVVRLNGRVPRYKSKKQVIGELENLYRLGWRENIFFVDDNFIGNKVAVKKELLPAIIAWQKKRKQPFGFITQASINLADDDELIKLMAEAGFATVFVGIETPNPESLKECDKVQNQNRDLLTSVRKIQNGGLEVQGGFIVGFDHDTSSIFKRQFDFIQKSGVVTAMVGLLSALPKTRLYQRLKESGRLLKETDGSNTSLDLNFVPKLMKRKVLINGYRDLLENLYSPKNYYQRVINFLQEFKPQLQRQNLSRLRFYHLKALFASLWLLGIQKKGRLYYWKLIFWSLFRHPQVLPQAIGFSITGLHFRRLYYQG